VAIEWKTGGGDVPSLALPGKKLNEMGPEQAEALFKLLA
jgi:hypothetical protein